MWLVELTSQAMCVSLLPYATVHKIQVWNHSLLIFFSSLRVLIPTLNKERWTR